MRLILALGCIIFACVLYAKVQENEGLQSQLATAQAQIAELSREPNRIPAPAPTPSAIQWNYDTGLDTPHSNDHYHSN